MLLFSFSIFSDQRSLKIENENNSMKIQMEKFDRTGLIYVIIGTRGRVLVRQGKQAMRVRANEVLLYAELFSVK